MADDQKMVVDNDPSDDTPFEALSKRSLEAAGYAYLLGDAALFAAGISKAQYKEAATGLMWGVGGLAAARYSHPTAEKQLELFGHRLGEYLHKQGIEIPKDPTTEILTKQQGIWDHVESFLYAYPSQTLNAVYAIGSTTLIASGIQKHNRGDLTAGLMVAAGALAGLLVPEKKIDPEHPPEGFLQKTAAWFQEKPLRLSSAFYWTNNVGLLAGAMEDQRTNPANKGYVFKYLTVASYVFANLMLSMSSKDNISGNDSTLNDLAKSSARVIAAQPPEMREALVQQIAGYLASQHEIHMKAEEIATLLHSKLAEVSIAPENWQGRVHSISGVPKHLL